MQVMNTTRYSENKRVFAWVLALAMLFQVLPVSAIADTIWSQPLRAASTYTATFMDGEDVVDVLQVAAGSAITEAPTAPEKDDGQFVAWLLNGEQVTFPYTPTGDVTLYSSYNTAYLVRFIIVNGDEVTVVASDYFAANELIGGLLPADPDRTGADFAGWFDGSTQITADTRVTAPITAYARFTNDVVVTFVVEGTDYAEERFVGAGSPLGALPENPFKSGYRFVGWFNGSEQVTQDTVVNESFTATAHFEEVRVFQVRASFYYVNAQGEDHEFDATIEQFERNNLPITIEVPPSTKVDEETEPDAAKQIYYPEILQLVITEADLDAAIAAADPGVTMVTVSKAVKFVPYTVTYKIDYMLKKINGSGYDLIEEVDGFGVKHSYIAPPVKEYTYADFESADNQVVDEDGTVLQVRYTRKDFTLTYDTAGGDYIAAVTHPYDTAVTLPATVNRAGYTFGGWYLDADCTQRAGNSVTLKKNTTVYAKWTPANVNYSIVYMIENADDDGYSFLATVTQQAATGTEVTLTAAQANNYAPTTGQNRLDKTNFTFKESTTETIKADGSTVIVVKYTRNVYTITWNGSGYEDYYVDWRGRAHSTWHTGRGYATLTAKYGADISAQWYETFNQPHPDWCWNFSSTNNDEKFTSLDIMPSGNKTVYHWYYTTTKTQVLNYWFENYDGSQTKTYNGRTYGLFKSVTVHYNYLYNTDYPDYAGYDKGGWVRSDGAQSLTDSAPNGTMTADFYYNAHAYPLTFYNYDGSLISTQQVTLNASISGYLTNNIPEAPVEGATWRGWFTDAEHTSAYGGGTKMPTGLVLYGDFTMPTYTFTFDPNGGELNGATAPVTVEEIPYGHKQENNQTPTRDGYVFTGWYTDANGTARYDFSKPLTDDVTVYAVWSPVPLSYTVHYYYEGTTSSLSDDRTVDARTYAVGDEVTEKAIAITGYKPDASTKSLILTSNDDENIIIFYYTVKPHDMTYTVNYMIAGTTIPVAPSDTYTVDGSTISVKAVAKPVDKAYMEANGASAEQLAAEYHPEAEVVEHVMTSGDNTITIYYNNYRTAEVLIHYLDMDGNPIRDSKTVSGKLNGTVSFGVTGFSGWSFKRSEIDGVSGTKKSIKLTQAKTYEVNVYFQKTLRIEGVEKTKVYDNEYLKLEGVGDVVVTGLQDGHTLTGIEFTNATGRKTVGTTAMKPKNPVISGASAGYYKFTYVSGHVEITPLDVLVVIDGDKVDTTYDGAVHTAGYSVTSISSPLFKPSYIQFNGTVSSVSRTDVGHNDLVLQGLFVKKISTATKNFNPTFQVTDGYVNITPATLTIYSDGAEKVYDGTPLTATGCRIEGLANGETLPVTAVASRTDVGEIYNDVELDWQNATAKESNYIFSWQNGKLEVTKATLTVTAVDQTYLYNGSEQGEGGTYTAPDNDLFTVEGLAETDTLTELTLTTEKQTEVGDYPDDIVPSGLAITYGHTKDSDIEELALDTNYDVVYVNGKLTITDREITVTYDPNGGELNGVEASDTATMATPYTVRAGSTVTRENYTFNSWNTSPDGDGISIAAGTAYDTGMALMSATGNSRPSVLLYAVWDANVEVEVTGSSETKTYNGNEQSNTGYTVTYKVAGEAVDTLPEGITATITAVQDGAVVDPIAASGTDVGTYTAAVTATLSGSPAGYVITTASDRDDVVLIIDKATMTVEAVDYSGTYDGEAHNGGATPSVTEGTTLQYSTDNGATWTAAVPSVKDVGTVSYTVKATNPNYEDATDDGTLEVTPVSIVLTANSAVKEYDGTVLTDDGYKITTGAFVGDEGLADVTVTGSQIRVGSSPNTITGHTLKDNTNPDNYDISYVPGTLEVTKSTKELKVTSADGEWTYDGAAHTNKTYTVTYGIRKQERHINVHSAYDGRIGADEGVHKSKSRKIRRRR